MLEDLSFELYIFNVIAEAEGFEPPDPVIGRRFSLPHSLLHEPSSALSVQML